MSQAVTEEDPSISSMRDSNGSTADDNSEFGSDDGSFPASPCSSASCSPLDSSALTAVAAATASIALDAVDGAAALVRIRSSTSPCTSPREESSKEEGGATKSATARPLCSSGGAGPQRRSRELILSALGPSVRESKRAPMREKPRKSKPASDSDGSKPRRSASGGISLAEVNGAVSINPLQALMSMSPRGPVRV